MKDTTGQTPTDPSPRAWPAVLTVAGSDSGGGAGIQADLKTFQSLRVFGTTAMTCVTAQNPEGVFGVEAVSAEMVVAQIDAVCDAFPIQAVKTGMLYASEIVRAVAQTLRAREVEHRVVDPVMVATSGARLLRPEAMQELMRTLLPLATVVTPNVPEAEILCGHSIADVSQLTQAAGEIAARFDTACIVKGGHLEAADSGDPRDAVTDVLCVKGETTVLTSPRIVVHETHGTGCTFSAALTAFLARGLDLAAAFAAAKDFVAAALVAPLRIGNHAPLAIGCAQ